MEMRNLCSLRDIYRMIRDFEIRFQQDHELSLNEGMLLCSLKTGKYSSSEIAELLGLTCSNASKIIRSAEEKGFVKRIYCKNDKRRMYFEISLMGEAKLSDIKKEEKTIEGVLNQISGK